MYIFECEQRPPSKRSFIQRLWRDRHFLESFSGQASVSVGADNPTISVRAILFLVCCVVFVSSSCLGDPYIQISSEIDAAWVRTGVTNQDESIAHQRFTTECIVGTNEWQIRIFGAYGPETVWFYDGTNVYESVRPIAKPPPELQEAMRKKLHLSPTSPQVALSNLTINIYPSSTGQPQGNYWVNIPWLAYCSGPYLKMPSRRVPPSVCDIRHEPDAFAYSDKTVVFGDMLGLPSELSLFASDSLFEGSVKRDEFMGSRDVKYWKRRLHNFKEGALKFHYVASQSTNFMGWTIPTVFEYSQIDPGPKGSLITNYGIGKVTAITASIEPEGVFNPTMQQTIVDWRLRSPKHRIFGVAYPSTKNLAEPTNDPMLQATLATAVAHAEAREPSPFGRIAIAVAVVLLLAFPIIVLLIQKNKQPKTNQ